VTPDETYWKFVNDGEIRVQQCANCQHRRFPPSEVCDACLSQECTWEKIEPGGTLITFFIVRDPGRAREGLSVPYCVGHADLDGGVRFTANVLDLDPDAVAIGMRVRLELRKSASGTLPQFVPE
jgi:uncharacterized OB-fold protein